MTLDGINIKYFLIGLILLIPAGVFCQVKIFTTDSINLKEWNFNQRKIVRNPGIGIIAESKNEIFFSYNLDDPVKILDGKNASLMVDNDSIIHIVYENNGIRYSIIPAVTDPQSGILISDIAGTGFSPVADCDKDGNVHIVYGVKDPANIAGTYLSSLKYAKVTNKQKQISSTIYDMKEKDSPYTLENYTIATHLLYIDETVFIAYQLSNDSIYLKYSLDHGISWITGTVLQGTDPKLSIGSGKYSGNLVENATFPVLQYLDIDGNLVNGFAEYYATTYDTNFWWMGGTKIQEGPIDFFCIDDIIMPFGYSYIFQKDGILYHAFSDFSENKIMDTVTNNALAASIAYKQFDLYQVDIVWYEKKDNLYEMYYNGFGKLAPTFPLQLTYTQSTVVCYEASDGFIHTKVTGGLPPYHYFWSTGDHTKDISNIPAGYYELSVYDMYDSYLYTFFYIPGSPPVETGEITGECQVNNSDTAIYSVSATSGSVYNWKVYGGILLNGQGSNSVNVQWGVAGSGKISVIETNKDGCKGDKVSMDVSIVQTSINPAKIQTFSIYPNPFSDNTKIRFPNPDSEPYQLSITNLSGKIVKITENINTDMIDLSRDGLPAGLYLIELKGSRIYRAKIVIE